MNITGLNESFIFIKKEVVEKESFPSDDGMEDKSFDAEQYINDRHVSAKIKKDPDMKLDPSSSTSVRGSGKVFKMGRGVTLKSQSRVFVKRLRDYFEKEKQNSAPLISFAQVTQRAADALCLSRATVSKVCKEEQVATPGKERKRDSPKSKLDSFNGTAVRNHIYSYYLRKELPTRKKLLLSLKESGLFDGGVTTLSVVLKRLGFKWKKIKNRKFLIERFDIVKWRCEFLRKIRSKDFNKLVFLDETWVNSGHRVSRTRSDDTVQSSRKEPTGKGQRLILTHAGTVDGFVPGALLIFRSKKEGDYHLEMNSNTFKQWFVKLLENLKPNSSIIMDNAPYQSLQINKAPTSGSTRAQIIDWLRRKNISFEHTLKKAELLAIVKNKKENFKTYELDNLASEMGHEILRLPPYHCHFNAIELIWAQIKEQVARKNKTFMISEVEKLTVDAINSVTPDDWRKVINQTKTIIDDAWKKEGILEERVDEMIISLSETSSTSNYDTDEEFSMSPQAGASGSQSVYPSSGSESDI